MFPLPDGAGAGFFSKETDSNGYAEMPSLGPEPEPQPKIKSWKGRDA